MNEKKESYNNLVDLRIKALNEIIEEEELVSILKFLLRFRGYQPIGDDTRENEYKKKEKCRINHEHQFLRSLGRRRAWPDRSWSLTHLARR